jgi:methionyl-tRNA formyltransferase
VTVEPGAGDRRRLAFLGTPADAVLPLRALARAGYDVAVVVTRPDRRRGRGTALVPSPVKAAAVEFGLPVSHRVDDVLDSGADLGVVVAYGQLIKPHVLARVPMLNLHFSALPRWRGAAPVERAILAGDRETAVCVMQLEEGLDTGPVHACRVVAIGEDETAPELRARMVEMGTEMLLELLAGDLGDPVAQVGEPTYAAKLEPEEFVLDWSRPAVELHRVVRAGPGRAHTTFRGRRLNVHRATRPPVEPGPRPAPGELAGSVVGTGEGVLRLVEVQPEGKGVQDAEAWVRGARLAPGDRLGS